MKIKIVHSFLCQPCLQQKVQQRRRNDSMTLHYQLCNRSPILSLLSRCIGQRYDHRNSGFEKKSCPISFFKIFILYSSSNVHFNYIAINKFYRTHCFALVAQWSIELQTSSLSRSDERNKSLRYKK